MATTFKNKDSRFDPVDSVRSYWKNNSQDFIPPVIGILCFLLIWQFIYSIGLTRLPEPLSVWTNERTRILLMYPFSDRGGLDKGLFWQTLASLERVAQGYSLAALIGIGTGILVGTNPKIDKALDPLFQFLRMVAPLAWVPIALIALPKNQPAAIFVIFITSVWPILINRLVGTFCTPQGLPQPALSSSLVGRVSHSLLVCGFGGEYDGV